MQSIDLTDQDNPFPHRIPKKLQLDDYSVEEGEPISENSGKNSQLINMEIEIRDQVHEIPTRKVTARAKKEFQPPRKKVPSTKNSQQERHLSSPPTLCRNSRYLIYLSYFL